MAQLRRNYQQFVQLNTEVVVIGPENAESLQRYWRTAALPFIGLPDPDHTVSRLYGQETSLFKLGRMPAQMLIDRSGILRFVSYGHSMADIPPAREVLNLLAAWSP